MTNPRNQPRTATIERKTSETQVRVSVNLDGTGRAQVGTGIGFLDHMLDALSRHGRIDIELSCTGDLHIDDHHTAEDCALALGACLRAALGDKRGIMRFGHAYAPLDEALARAVVDLSGRAHATIELGLSRRSIGELACENVSHFFRSLAMELRCALHLDVLRGENDHHRAEAATKALALALRQAVARTGFDDIASTKGAL